MSLRNSLALKLSALILLAFVFSFAFGFLFNGVVGEVERGQRAMPFPPFGGRVEAGLAARLLELENVGSLGDQQLQSALDRCRSRTPQLFVGLVDVQGRLLASSGNAGSFRPSQAELLAAIDAVGVEGSAPLRAPPSRGGFGMPAFTLDRILDPTPVRAGLASAQPAPARTNAPPRTPSTRTLFVVAGVPPLIAPREGSFQTFRLLSMPLVFLLASGVAGYLSIRLFSSRLRGLEQGVELLTRGNLSYRVDPGPADEIGRLGQAFNQMADSLEKAIAELSEQDRARREILADVAHELRTPLTSMMCQVQSLQEDLATRDPQLAAQFEPVAEDGLTLGKRIKDLLTIAREEARSLPLELKSLDLAELLEDLAEHHRPLLQRRSVRFLLEAGDAPLPISGDRDRLMQVFENLLQNALQSLGEAGEVRIRAASSNGSAIAEFRDNGSGISAAELPTIFERFRRGKGSRGPGTGLGLAIVKKFVELHGGSCSAESEPGKGSVFTIRLPLHAGEAATKQ
ncbi:MAG: HAMP domain-containing histidine kinase [Candidatus Wallbacteria bacterium]|nr:HAMP domain-containing histidine kinase [Candidatus Wallbacteria bacterium]